MTFNERDFGFWLEEVSSFDIHDDERLKKLAKEGLLPMDEGVREKRSLKTWWINEGVLGIDTAAFRKELAILLQWCREIGQIPELKVHQIYPFFKTTGFNTKQCYRLIRKYYRFRRNLLPDLFEYRDPYSEKIQNIWKVINFAPILGLTNDKSLIIFIGLKFHNPALFDIMSALRLFIMSMEVCNMQFSIPNTYEFVIDITGFSIYHIPRRFFPIVKKFIRFLEEAIPINVRAIHVAKTKRKNMCMFRTILAMVDRKLRSKILIHKGDDLTTLHTAVHQKYLPCELKGKKGFVKHHEEIFRGKLEKLWGWFEEEEQSWTNFAYHISSESSIAITSMTSFVKLSSSSEGTKYEVDVGAIVNEILNYLLAKVMKKVTIKYTLLAKSESLEMNWAQTMGRIKRYHAINSKMNQSLCPGTKDAVDYLMQLNTLHGGCFGTDAMFV